MEIRRSKTALEKSIVSALKTVYDPEIPVDIYELGLIYEIKINEDRRGNHSDDLDLA